MAEAAAGVGAHLVYISTDYVFDGTLDRPYVEWDQPNPRSVYGRSKLGGELEVHAVAGPSATVVRTAWVCGAHGANMVRTVLRLAAADPGGPLRFVDDQHGCPTFTADLARAVVRLALDRRPGTFHVTNQGATTWFGFARAALAAAGHDPDRVEPIATAELDPPRPGPPAGQLDARQRRPAAVRPAPAARLAGRLARLVGVPVLGPLRWRPGVPAARTECFRTGENEPRWEGRPADWTTEDDGTDRDVVELVGVGGSSVRARPDRSGRRCPLRPRRGRGPGAAARPRAHGGRHRGRLRGPSHRGHPGPPRPPGDLRRHRSGQGGHADQGRVPIVEDGLEELVRRARPPGGSGSWSAPPRRWRGPSSSSSASPPPRATTGRPTSPSSRRWPRRSRPSSLPGADRRQQVDGAGGLDPGGRAGPRPARRHRGVQPRVPAGGDRRPRQPPPRAHRGGRRRPGGRGQGGRPLRRHPRPADRHRRGHGRDHQVRLQRLPGHQAELRQRRGRPVRGGGGGRPGRHPGHGLRQAHRVRVPPSRAGLGRLLPAQGHPGPGAASPSRRATTSPSCGGPSTPTTSSSSGSWTRSGRRSAGRSRARSVAAWGLTFKAGTDDLRNSPAVEIVRRLVEGGAIVRAFDPTVSVPAGQQSAPIGGLSESPRRRSRPRQAGAAYPDAYAACEGAAAAVVLTEWDEFRWLDFAKVRATMAAPVVVDARNLLDPAQLRRIGFAYTGIGRPMSGRRGGARAGRGSSGPTSATLCVGAGRRGRLRRRPLHRPAGPTWPTSTGIPASSWSRPTSRVSLPVDGPVDAACFNLASPASPPDYLARPLETLAVGERGDPARPRAGPRPRGPVPAGVDQRGLRRPRGAPPDRGVLGQRQPGRAPQRLRRGQAVRRGPDHGLPPRPRHRRRHRPDLQHLRAPAPARGRAGGLQLPRSRPCGASRSPSTATAARPGASASSRTRWRAAGPARLRPHRPGQHRQPRRAHRPRAGPHRARAARSRRRRSSTARCRSTTPPAGGRTSPWPGPRWAGSRSPSSGTGCCARPAYLAEDAGVAAPVRRPSAEPASTDGNSADE